MFAHSPSPNTSFLFYKRQHWGQIRLGVCKMFSGNKQTCIPLRKIEICTFKSFVYHCSRDTCLSSTSTWAQTYNSLCRLPLQFTSNQISPVLLISLRCWLKTHHLKFTSYCIFLWNRGDMSDVSVQVFYGIKTHHKACVHYSSRAYLHYLCTEQDCVCSLHSGLVTHCLSYNENQSGFRPAMRDDTIIVHKSYCAAGTVVLPLQPPASVRFSMLPASFEVLWKLPTNTGNMPVFSNSLTVNPFQFLFLLFFSWPEWCRCCVKCCLHWSLLYTSESYMHSCCVIIAAIAPNGETLIGVCCFLF